MENSNKRFRKNYNPNPSYRFSLVHTSLLKLWMDFFDYSDQFPYPPIAKIIYKATIGVYGLIGILLIGCYKLLGLNNWRKKQLNSVTLFQVNDYYLYVTL